MKFDRIIKATKLHLKVAKIFGIRAGYIDFKHRLLFRNNRRVEKEYNDYFIGVIEEEFSEIITSYSRMDVNISELTTIDTNSPIWIFWWQGIDAAPELVRCCYKSIVENSGTHPVIVIDKTNISMYASISNEINSLMENGKISITFYSDILRCNLLYNHGGVWLDSTVLMTGNISKWIDHKVFYTIKHNQFSNYHICEGKWTGFCLSSGEHNPLFKYMCDMFDAFLEKYDFVPMYLLIDVFLSVGHKNIPFIKQMIREVPINNIKVFELQGLLNQPEDIEGISDVFENQDFHKLSYKKPLVKEINHHETLWGSLAFKYK